jgi:hypothetical protein
VDICNYFFKTLPRFFAAHKMPTKTAGNAGRMGRTVEKQALARRVVAALAMQPDLTAADSVSASRFRQAARPKVSQGR